MPSDDDLVYLERDESEDPPANWVSVVAVLSMLAVIGIIVFLGLTA